MSKKKKQVHVEEVMYIMKKKYQINKVRLEDIVWFEKGKALNIDKDIINEFEITGLSNVDFITTEYYKR